MTKRKSTKRALLLSVLSLLMCVSMLIGSTFAWFTDSVTSASNKIQGGNLSLDLELLKKNADGTTTWSSIKKSQEPIFNYDKWEPGYTDVKILKVENEGSLALKWYAKFVSEKLIGELAQVIDVYVCPSETTELAYPENRDLTGYTYVGTLNQFVNTIESTTYGYLAAGKSAYLGIALKMQESAGNEYMNKSLGEFDIQILATQDTVEPDSFSIDYDANATYPLITSKTIGGNGVISAGTVSVTLPRTAEEAYYTLNIDNRTDITDEQGQTKLSLNIDLLKNGVKVESNPGVSYTVTIALGKNLNVTEVMHKNEQVTNFSYSRSTGKLSFKTESFSPFSAVYNTGNLTETSLNLIALGGEYTLIEDVSADQTLVIPEGVTVKLNLNGKQIRANIHKDAGPVIRNEGTLTISNGTVSSVAGNGGSAITNIGTLTASDATLNGAPNAGDGWPSYTVNNSGIAKLTGVTITSTHGAVASYGEGAEVTLNNSVIDMAGIAGFTSHGIYTYSNGVVTVEGGTYTNRAADQSATGASVINGAVTILDGTFSGRIEKYEGTPILKGGNYTVKPDASFVDPTCEVIDNANGTFSVLPLPVAKIGDTEYRWFNEAAEHWTNGTTLTLIRNATMTDVVKLSSTEYHILDLGTYTLTAAPKMNAIEIVANGRTSASYALDIKADAQNPGGITATGKAVVRTTGKSGLKDRPIIRFYNGVFTGSYVVQHTGSNGTNCPQFQFHGGVFNGAISTNRSLNQFYGGTFNSSLMMSVDSSAYALVSGGTFKNLSNLYMSTLNSSKFTIGSNKGVYDREVYVDENGYYVVAKTQPENIEASVAMNPNSNDYFAYSKVKAAGAMNYTDVYTALKNNKSAKITVYVDELNLANISFTGTIIVPEGQTLTIINAPANLNVEGDVNYS